ncbi:hypothetical protein ACDT12_13775, partial [Staphylococcus aureus]
ESLEGNMEDNEGVENAKEEVKLGKLQFSMDYDFQKSEVRLIDSINKIRVLMNRLLSIEAFSWGHTSRRSINLSMRLINTSADVIIMLIKITR